MAFAPTSLLPLRTPRPLTSTFTSVSRSQTIVTSKSRRARLTMSSTEVKTKSGMKKISQADEATIEKLGCKSWGKWGCEASKFPWTYDDDEVCLILQGEFTVKDDKSGEVLEVREGDVAYFPKGMSCTWDVTKAVDKHFKFGISI